MEIVSHRGIICYRNVSQMCTSLSLLFMDVSFCDSLLSPWSSIHSRSRLNVNVGFCSGWWQIVGALYTGHSHSFAPSLPPHRQTLARDFLLSLSQRLRPVLTPNNHKGAFMIRRTENSSLTPGFLAPGGLSRASKHCRKMRGKAKERRWIERDRKTERQKEVCWAVTPRFGAHSCGGAICWERVQSNTHPFLYINITTQILYCTTHMSIYTCICAALTLCQSNVSKPSTSFCGDGIKSQWHLFSHFGNLHHWMQCLKCRLLLYCRFYRCFFFSSFLQFESQHTREDTSDNIGHKEETEY